MSKFAKAFKEARAKGLKEFSFGGKSYHTKTADEMGSAPKPKSKPKMSSKDVSDSYQRTVGAASAPKPKSKPKMSPGDVKDSFTRMASNAPKPKSKPDMGVKTASAYKSGGMVKGKKGC